MPNTYTSQSEIARRQALMEAMAGRNTTGQGIGGGLANMLRSYRGAKENAALGQAEAQNQSIDDAERQMIVKQLQTNAPNAAPGVLKPGEQYNFQGKYADFPLQQAMSQQSARDAMAEKEREAALKTTVVGPGSQLFTGGNLTASNPNQRGSLVNIDNTPNKFLTDLGATNNTQLEAAATEAEAAFGRIEAMDRFLSISDGAAQGAAQPVLTLFKNLGASFGVEMPGLTEEQIGDAAVSGVMVGYLEEMGARGLTDGENRTILASLPNLATSKEAREAIANIVKNRELEKIKNYDYMRSQFEDQYKGTGAFFPKSKKYNDWKTGATPPLYQPPGREKDIDSMSVEELRAYILENSGSPQ